MVVGFEVTKTDLDRRMGGSVIALREAFVQIARVQEYLGRMTEGDLTEMGYSAEEIALIKSSFSSLTTLKDVAEGKKAQPEADNFFFWASRLTGLE